ncbi:hypothetical protein [Microvirga massiliensis]|uniref:hypothetical protein n=1 Tax=Microvirga massiliensis TaxID=1033741 RepID=UPI0006608891|nr:hypothetical protein [Microvirga massiliensis]
MQEATIQIIIGALIAIGGLLALPTGVVLLFFKSKRSLGAKMIFFSPITLIAGVFMAGTGYDAQKARESGVAAAQPAPPHLSAAQGAARVKAEEEVKVKADTFDPWPFKTDEITLSCELSRVFVTTPDGRRYAVNGTARNFAPEPRIQTIQAHYDISAVIRRGLELCDTGSRPIRIAAPVRVAPPEPDPPSLKIEAGGLGTGFFGTVEANEVIDGKRPELTFACKPGEPLGLQLDLIRAPQTAPPLRGVFGTFQIDGTEPVKVELAWVGLNGQWLLQRETDQDRVLQDDRLARALLKGQRVTFTGPAGFIAHSRITWALASLGDHFDEIRKTCGVRGAVTQDEVERSSGPMIEVRISAATDGTARPIITGQTNLPDGAELLVSVWRPSAHFMAQHKVPVIGGAFKAGPFGSRQGPLHPGEYEVSVSMSIPRNQPASVQAVIGDKGQNLKGPHVRESGIGSGNVVDYEFPLVIPGDSTQGLPKEWRTITHDFCTADQAGSACPELSMRLDTEQKVEQKFGYKVRGERGTEVFGVCMRALMDFKGSEADCNKAWADYGCQGQKHARLLYMTGSGKSFCKY